MKHIIFTIADQGPFSGQLGRDRDSGRTTLSLDSDTLDPMLFLRGRQAIHITYDGHPILEAHALPIFDLLAQGPGGMSIKNLWLEAH